LRSPRSTPTGDARRPQCRADAGAEGLFGWRADEAIGESWFALVERDPAARSSPAGSSRATGTSTGHDLPYVGKHGSVHAGTHVVAVGDPERPEGYGA
jgi:hypothetical protein